MATFGERLRSLRIEKELNQEEFGKLFNMTKSRISQYETSRNEADDETKKIFADYFNVSLDYLMGRSNVRNHDEKIEHSYLRGISKIINENGEITGKINDLRLLCKEQILNKNVNSIPKNILEIIIDRLTKIQNMAEDEKIINNTNYNNLLYQYCIINLYFKKLLETIIDEEIIDITKLKKEATYALKHVNKNIDTRLKEIQIIENLDIYNIDQEFLDKNKQIDISEDTTFLIAAHNDNPEADQQEKMKRDAEKIKNLKK